MYPTVEFSRKMMKQLVGLLCLAAALVWGVQHSVQLMGWLRVFLGIVQPFLLGCAIAFVLNLPLRAIERKLLRRWNSAARRPVSLLMSLGFVILVVALVVVMIVPELVEAIADIVQQVPVALERLVLWLNEMAVRYPQLDQSAAVLAQLEENWQEIVENALSMLKHGLGSVVSTTIGVAGSVISGVATTFIAFVFSFYLLMQKEKIAGQVKRVLTAYLPSRAAERTVQVCCLLDKNFSSFIAGQCLEAVILGSMFVVSMTLLRMPYAVMVGVLIAFTALIPIVGAFIGCFVGAFLILLENPMQAVAFVVLFLVLQQLEGNFIYPRVVGSSVGLPSIWVLAAVTVGGSLFGIVGMLVFIPLISTAYSLLRDSVNARNAARAAQNVPSPPQAE